ncbi:MAG: hypothetical protein WB579_06070 [Bryobacteraceae bacterium]
MNKVFQLAALGAIFIASANASLIVLNFEGLQNDEGVLSYYDGGYGSLGSGPGPSYGVTFTSNGTAFISTNEDFAGNPSGDTAFTFVSDSNPAIMDVPAGFDTGFSFYYSAAYDTGEIDVYSGLDGTGTELASITPPVTENGYESGNPACPDSKDVFCPFFPLGVSFSGTAESVVFTNTEGLVALDDITLGSDEPDDIPEPPAFSLAGLGLASLLVISRRRHNLQ